MLVSSRLRRSPALESESDCATQPSALVSTPPPIAVTADFLRRHYPEGLADTLFILGSCNTFRADMADAIAGDRGIFVSWDGCIEFSLVKNTSLTLLDSLGLGVTVGEAFARLPAFSPENPAAAGSTLQQTGRRAGGDLRIRDLISVRDSLTGKPVTYTSGIEVIEVPGDGQNDNLDLEFVIDGVTPEQLANFYVNLVINDHVIGHLDVQQSGVQVGEFRYQVPTPVPQPFDAQAGQALNMDFWIPLPDLGEDHFVAGPKVNGSDLPQVGGEWVLSSVATQNRTDDVTIKTASVVFEMEPDDDPEGRYHYFRVKSGNVRIQREYEDALADRPDDGQLRRLGQRDRGRRPFHGRRGARARRFGAGRPQRRRRFPHRDPVDPDQDSLSGRGARGRPDLSCIGSKACPNWTSQGGRR